MLRMYYGRVGVAHGIVFYKKVGLDPAKGSEKKDLV